MSSSQIEQVSESSAVLYSPPKNIAWHHKSSDEVIGTLKTDKKSGLPKSEVSERRRLYGENELGEDSGPGLFVRFFKQFQNPLVFILLAAAVVTTVLGEFIDTMVIGAALLINVIIGTFQEGRASLAFDKLKSSQTHNTIVFRDGQKHVIPSSDLVVGDIVELNAGDYVPADIRLLAEDDLRINEAALTGESIGVTKDTSVIEEDVPVPERSNMAWMGTVVETGEGSGVITAVGVSTELGKIAESLQEEDSVETPIQMHMKQIARFIAVFAIVSVAFIFLLGLLRGFSVSHMLLYSVAVAVSIVPEGLPAAVTVVLAIGMERILDRRGLIKNLQAAETLGSTTVIMTDKTGTLTEARMSVDDLIVGDRFRMSGEQIGVENTAGLSDDAYAFLTHAILVTDAFVEHKEDENTFHGDPLEVALLKCGYENSLEKRELTKSHPQLDYLAFSSKNRFAVSLNKFPDNSHVVTLSGSPEHILEMCEEVYINNESHPLTDELRERIKTIQRKQSHAGLRLTASACKTIPEANEIPQHDEGVVADSLTEGLVFLGLAVFSDPLRGDVFEAIKTAQSAGAHVLMVTGDNPNTAAKIAVEAGVAEPGVKAIIGSEIESMLDSELIEILKTNVVFARVLPNQKLRMARLLREHGEVVAMTGDGVNDAPALRTASIGVAVGSGTEVAKEASDLILLDDSFAIIVSAIEEGRRIIDNLKKIVALLIATTFGEVVLVAGALIAGLDLPVTFAQILWINIIEGGLLTFVFAFEPPALGIMKRNPRDASVTKLISRELKGLMIAAGVATGVLTTALYFWLNSLGMPLSEIRTIMFVALSLDALLFTLSLKNFYRPIWKLDFLSNKYLLVAEAVSTIVLLATLFLPIFRNPDFLAITPLSSNQWLILLVVGILDIVLIEVAKYLIYTHKILGDVPDAQRIEKENTSTVTT